MNKITIAIHILITFCYLSYAQLYEKRDQGKISGKVLDISSGTPVEYANIIVFNMVDSNQVTGGITNKEGAFIIGGIPFGKYYLNVQFIGYEKKKIDNVLINSPNTLDLGDIFIRVTSINLENII